MQRKYFVFIDNVGSCNDRYCGAYGRLFSMEEKFDRVKSIPFENVLRDWAARPDACSVDKK